MIDPEWFSKKEKKFLHNIDTFYFSIKLEEDFTRNSTDPVVARFRRMIERYKNTDADFIPFMEVPYSTEVEYVYGCFDSYYNFILHVKEQFDICIAPVVPPASSGIASVTSEIIVKIHARMLWELGATLAFKQTYEYVKSLCEHYHLTIKEVKENRCDFCWHTNALQDPETYFRIDNFSEMQVSRFKGVNYHYKLLNKRKLKGGKRYQKSAELEREPERHRAKPECFEEPEKPYEWDYLALGRRGDKCFVRVYLKTKEVIEMHYKEWFLYTWYYQGLISKYDLYVLEKAYKEKRWSYCDIARLQFALEYDDSLSAAARSLICSHIEAKTPDYASIAALANKYTPKLTKIINVEFQVMRRMSKSFKLLPPKENQGEAKRIFDFLDDRRRITEYLTHDTLRLVRPGNDCNTSRSEYTDFWRRLRGTKIVDVVLNKHQLKLVRDYSSKLNMEIRKTTAVRAVSNFALQLKRNPDATIYEDAAELLAILNDNDFEKLYKYKNKRYRQLRPPEEDPLVSLTLQRNVKILPDESGEFYENT
ncbi:MAG: hypothetical protein IJY09_06400 [Lachnospiraceae bacterium]|nr:hypothetical protein [Lachnospiraceae bacterium]